VHGRRRPPGAGPPSLSRVTGQTRLVCHCAHDCCMPLWLCSRCWPAWLPQMRCHLKLFLDCKVRYACAVATLLDFCQSAQGSRMASRMHKMSALLVASSKGCQCHRDACAPGCGGHAGRAGRAAFTGRRGGRGVRGLRRATGGAVWYCGAAGGEWDDASVPNSICWAAGSRRRVTGHSRASPWAGLACPSLRACGWVWRSRRPRPKMAAERPMSP